MTEKEQDLLNKVMKEGEVSLGRHSQGDYLARELIKATRMSIGYGPIAQDAIMEAYASGKYESIRTVAIDNTSGDVFVIARPKTTSNE